MDETRYLQIIEVANYESYLKIQEFKIADLIWRIKMEKVTSFRLNSLLGGFRGRLL